MNRFSLRLVALAAALAPAMAFAQGGSVTTSPLAQPAPTLSATLLLLLSLALVGVAWHMLRRSPARSVAAAALAVVMAAGAGIGYATPTNVVIDGEECMQRYTHSYNSNYGPRNLVSLCQNPIEIVVVTPGCNGNDVLAGDSNEQLEQLCSNGLVLQYEEACMLPDCAG